MRLKCTQMNMQNTINNIKIAPLQKIMVDRRYQTMNSIVANSTLWYAYCDGTKSDLRVLIEDSLFFCAKVELKKIPFTEFTNQNLSHCSEFRNFCSYAINLLPFHKRIKKICFFPFLCGCWWNSFGSGESRDLMPGSLFTLRTIAHDLQTRLLLDGDNNKWAKKKGVLFFSFKWRQANAPTSLTHLLLNWCCI